MPDCEMNLLTVSLCAGDGVMSCARFLLSQRAEGINADEISDDEDLATCLASCKYLKGNYTHHERPEMYLFESLALCQRTSEKQSASALDLASVFCGSCAHQACSTGPEIFARCACPVCIGVQQGRWPGALDITLH